MKTNLASLKGRKGLKVALVVVSIVLAICFIIAVKSHAETTECKLAIYRKTLLPISLPETTTITIPVPFSSMSITEFADALRENKPIAVNADNLYTLNLGRDVRRVKLTCPLSDGEFEFAVRKK